VTNSRATDGYRRVWAMVNRTFRTGYNRKRIRRLMRMYGLMLPPRVHRRHGRPHLGQVQQPASNRRWCSDIFLIPCWSSEVISVAFAIDCLSDNGPQYTATASVLYAHELGLAPITTPAYSPESNGLAEVLVRTFKRDYVNVHELRDAESVLARLGGWIDDYKPPGALFGARHAEPGQLSGAGFSQQRTHAPICLGLWGADQAGDTAHRWSPARWSFDPEPGTARSQ
jgi:putative transposase